MATVTYDDSSFLVDGKRVWLVSGSIHYFRVPRELWRDRLLNELSATGHVEEHFTPNSHVRVGRGEQDVADLFANRCAAGLSNLADLQASASGCSGKPAQLR